MNASLIKIVIPSYVFIILCFDLFNIAFATPGNETVKIGVLAFRSAEKTIERWTPTAKQLSSVIKDKSFEIIPMNYPQVNEAVTKNTIDFILTNTGHYVELEAEHGIARIATLVNSIDESSLKVFGGVIFTHSNNSDINALEDLKGKTFLAVKKSSLGGFLVGWEQLKQSGIDPFSDLKSIEFNGMPHDNVVLRVLNGEFDAGTIRTNILEEMIKEDVINRNSIKIINQKTDENFPYIHSTKLYPEWPFSRLPHANDSLVEQVTVALLNIQKDHPAAKAGKYDRWAPPLDYSTVHLMFKDLKAGPYKNLGKFTFQDVFKKYLTEIILTLIVFVIGFISLVRIVSLNRSLKKANTEVKILQGFIPICSSCKKIRDDTGFWNQIESYIEKHSQASFSHGICPDCTEKLYGNEDWYDEIKKIE